MAKGENTEPLPQPSQGPLRKNEQFWKTLGQTRMDLASLPLWTFIKIESFPILDFPINTFQRKLSLMRPFLHVVQKMWDSCIEIQNLCYLSL